MDRRHLWFDNRLKGFCIYCGRHSETRDHVPSKVLLDKPFPKNLPVVECCLECNLSFSADEEYVACFIECILAGSTDPSKLKRAKVVKILEKKASLAKRISSSRKSLSKKMNYWKPEMNRIEKIILKLARGHLDFELSLQRMDQPSNVTIVPIMMMNKEESDQFVIPPNIHLYPELGSRSFLKGKDTLWHSWSDWNVVQPGRYQY